MDPITAISVAGSAVGIAGFGLQIATVLQTYIEASLEADDRIRDIANDINAAASALQRLQAVIDDDEKLAEARVFNVEGLKSVNRISLQCDAVFKRTVELLNKAGRPGAELSKAERAKELKLHSLDHLKWPWLEPKILRCRQELERLLLKMLLMLQISSLAHQQKSAIERRPDDFAKERELRDVIARLSLREQRLTRQLERAHLRPRRIYVKPDVEDELPGSEEAALKETVVIGDDQMNSVATNDVPALDKTHAKSPDRGLDAVANSGFVQAPSQHLTSVLHGRGEFADTIVTDEATKEIDLLASEKSREVAANKPNQSPFARNSSSLHKRHEPNIEFGKLRSEPTLSSTNAPQRPRPNSQGSSTRDSHQIRPSQSRKVPPQSKEIMDQRIEAYLIKDGQGQVLKMPLDQPELQNQLEAVLSRSKDSPWNVLVSLSSKEQGSINSVVELGRSKDGCERLLAAIEVQERMEKADRRMWHRKKERKAVQHILLFLRLVPDDEKEKEYKRRVEGDLRKSGMNDEQIAVVLRKEKAANTNISTWTRMSRRHLSIEALNRNGIAYEFDADPDYVLIKRWIPEYEQNILWNQTKEIRAKRNPVLLEIEGQKHRHEDIEFEFVRKKRDEKKPTASPLLTFLAGGSKSRGRKFTSNDTEDYELGKEKRPLFEPDAKVNELLTKWTTAFGETATEDERTDEGPLVGAEDGDDFLEFTKLDDYFSDDEVSSGSSFSSGLKDD